MTVPEPKPLEDLDVMILAAGLGTRMQPLTNSLPKPLLPVLGRPLLVWSLWELASQGSRHVVVNSHHLAGDLESYVEAELPQAFADPEAPPRPEVRIVREMILLGTGGGLGNAAPLLRSDPVLTWNVDLLYRPDLAAARAIHERDDALATLILTRSPMHAKIALEGTRIRSVAEEADPSDSSLWAYTGVMLLSQEALGQLPAGQFDELPPRLRGWAAEGRLSGYTEPANFLEVGTLASYLEVHRRLAESPQLLPGPAPARVIPLPEFGYLDSAVRIEGEPKMEDSVILPGAVVRPEAVIRRSIVGPGAVADGEIFGECLAEGTSSRFATLDRSSEAAFRGFLSRHTDIWPKDARKAPKTLSPLHGDGSGRRLVRVISEGWSHVLVAPAPATPASIYPRRSGAGVPDEPTTFAYIAGILQQRGVRVPEIRVHERDSGFLLVEDLGNRTLHEVTGSASAEQTRDLYRQAVDLLVAMQREEGESFDPERVQSPSYSAQFALEFECRYFQREFVEGVLGEPEATPELEAEFATIARACAEGADLVLVHRDFQSRNLMVTARGLAAIDFQGARLGPPLYDLVSLVFDPYLSPDDGDLRSELIEIFFKHAGLDEGMRTMIAPTAICRLLQTLGAFGYLGGRCGKPGFLEHAPRALDHVSVLTEGEHPHLAILAKRLREKIETR